MVVEAGSAIEAAKIYYDEYKALPTDIVSEGSRLSLERELLESKKYIAALEKEREELRCQFTLMKDRMGGMESSLESMLKILAEEKETE